MEEKQQCGWLIINVDPRPSLSFSRATILQSRKCSISILKVDGILLYGFRNQDHTLRHSRDHMNVSHKELRPLVNLIYAVYTDCHQHFQGFSSYPLLDLLNGRCH